MKVWIVTIAGLFFGSAQAEPWINYSELLRVHADKVVTTKSKDGTTERSIDFGNGVTVVCQGEDGDMVCVGGDTSKEGAVGCLFAIVQEIGASLRACPSTIDADTEGRFLAIEDRLGAFVAENTVPMRPWADLKADLHRLYDEEMQSGKPKPKQCADAFAEESDLGILLRMVTAEKAQGELDAAVSKPKLPVINPCL